MNNQLLQLLQQQQQQAQPRNSLVNDPMMAAGMALLNAGGPQLTPSSVGQNLAQGWKAYQGQVNANEQAAMEKLLLMQKLQGGTDPTSLMKHAAALGLKQGTPEYNEFLKQVLLKPDTMINMGGEPRVLTTEEKTKYGFPVDNVVTLTPKGDFKVAHKSPQVTEGEAKQMANFKLGARMLSEVETLVGSGKVDPSSNSFYLRTKAATTPLVSGLASMTGNELSANEADVASSLEILSNIMLAAMRGAQVGPEEQKKFNEQLPRIGQSEEIFKANLRKTQENLEELRESIKTLRNPTAQPETVKKVGKYTVKVIE